MYKYMTPFECNRVIIKSGASQINNFHLNTFDLDTMLPGYLCRLYNITELNAIGYNPLDDYVYGYGYDSGTSMIVRIGSDCDVVSLGLPAGITNSATFTCGTFDMAGFYYLYMTTCE